MFHAYIIPIAYIFYTHFVLFYAFSATNLLTRCHSANSLFAAVFSFRTALKEISAKLETSQPGFIFGIFASRKTEEGPRDGLIAWWRGPTASIFRPYKPPGLKPGHG